MVPVPRKYFAIGSMIDVILLLVMMAVAVGSGSLTLLGETIRSILIVTTAAWSTEVRAKAERDTNRGYEFGTGKLEQAGNLIIALGLTIAGLWVAGRAFEVILVGGETEPLGLSLAAAIHAVHTLRIGFSVRATPATKNDESVRAVTPPVGTFRFASLLIVQATLTVAALVRDPAIALTADCAGAVFVSLLMTTAGIKMLWEALRDLIDHPLPPEDEKVLSHLLLEHGVLVEELVGVRSRRSGRHVFVEFTIDPVENPSIEETRERLANARRGLEERLRGLDVAIRLYASKS